MPPIPTNMCSLGQLLTQSTMANLTVEVDGRTQWNHTLITYLWERDTAELIVQIPLGGIDIRCWGNNPACTCTLKSLYHIRAIPQLAPITLGIVGIRLPGQAQAFPMEGNTRSVVI